MTKERTRVEHVVAISIDALNPTAVERLGAERTPTFSQLRREGASTLNARTAPELTQTLPNHTTMFTGRRVDASEGGHGVTFNTDTGTTVHRTAEAYVPSVFDVVHDSGGSTALFAAKRKFALYERTWNRRGARDRTGPDDGRAKIDTFVSDTDNSRLISRVTADLRTRPRDFTFVHISLPDDAGHDRGFMTPRYLRAVERSDRLVGRLLGVVTAEPLLRRDTLLVVTSDHGAGIGKDHSDPTRPENYRIPFLAWGAGVPRGQDLYRLNSDYADPGNERASSDGRPPIRNGDLANLVAAALGLPKVPGSQYGRDDALDVG